MWYIAKVIVIYSYSGAPRKQNPLVNKIWLYIHPRVCGCHVTDARPHHRETNVKSCIF